MSGSFDGFQDVRNRDYGILDGDAISEHCSVTWRPGKHGVELQMCCHNCGGFKMFTIEWPEVVALKYDLDPMEVFRGYPGMVVNPASWVWDGQENAYAPDVNCPDCYPPSRLPLLVEPQDPERYLAAGRRQGLINPDGEKQVALICMQARQQRRGLRR